MIDIFSTTALLTCVAIGIVGLLIGMAVALYVKLKSRRSGRERRAKAVSRFMAREAGVSASGESGGTDFDGDD